MDDESTIALAGRYLDTLLGHLEKSSLWKCQLVASAKRAERSFDSERSSAKRSRTAETTTPPTTTIATDSVSAGSPDYQTMVGMAFDRLLEEAKRYKHAADVCVGSQKCHMYLLAGMGFTLASNRRSDFLPSTITFLTQSARSATALRGHLSLFKALLAYANFRLFVARLPQLAGTHSRLAAAKWSESSLLAQYAKDGEVLFLAWTYWEESLEFGPFLSRYPRTFTALESDDFLPALSLFLDSIK